jgi:potassium-transporting ATPase KdpC subunit
MRRHMIASVIMLLAVTAVLGFGYPLLVTGLSALLFRHQADGSLVYRDGRLAGSSLLGQRYARGPGDSYVCDPNTVPERAIAYRAFNGLPAGAPVPVDAVTASASGLDPDISVANALDQAPRVARARHLPVGRAIALVRRYTQGSQWGFLGEPTVNVLDLNLALDKIR